MEVIHQSLRQILDALSSLRVEWEDDTARRVIKKLENFQPCPDYTAQDVIDLLNDHFDDGMLICRLFLGLSKDAFIAELTSLLPQPGGVGVTRFRKDSDAFVSSIVALGILDAIASHANREPMWSDVLVERLRSGRGSAISGQRRGRGVEDFVEDVVRRVFGERYDARCNFIGARDRRAKCDFAIPNKQDPSIIIESKGYGATGSKMTDIIGDIEKIIATKRHDMAFIFFTDGLTWRNRSSDLAKVVSYQNNGEVTRIYTLKMADQFEADLRILQMERGL